MTEEFNRKYLTKRRKVLRSNLTPAEAGLWKYLKNRQLEGRKFRRQYSIGDYIVDLYCPEERLAIELDGEVHKYDTTNKNDREKEIYLSERGIKLLRFENKLVFEHLELVLRKIISNLVPPPPDKSGDPSL